MKKLEYIETFVEVVKAGSFAKAAAKLNLTAAAVGKQIQVLEDRSGHQFLHRLPSGISLTEVGETFYQHSISIVEQLHDTEHVLDSLKGDPKGSLRIAANYVFSEHFIIPNVLEFNQRFPNLHLKIKVSEYYPNLEKENIDILFDFALNNPEALDIVDYVCRKIGDTRLILCASPDYIEKNGMPTSIESLHHHRYITHSSRKLPNRVSLKNTEYIDLNAFLEVDISRSLAALALTGAGIVWVECHEVESYIKNQQLIEILPEFAANKIPLGAYYRKTKFPVPKIRTFVDFMISKYQQITV